MNCPKEDRKSFRMTGRKHLESRAEDFRFWMIWGTDEDHVNEMVERCDKSEKAKQTILEEYGSRGSFYDYGLSIDYVVPGTFKNKEGYLRYQLSWGGPSEEVRFYWSPGSHEAYKIEFVYMDWGTGVGFNVLREDWAQWLFNYFDETGTLEAEQRKALAEA